MDEVTDPYASHLPTLRFVLALVKPKRVLELGAGIYSTPLFLACPSVERLETIETDERWVPEPSERLTVRLVKDTVEALPEDLTAYDLVFIDNADNPADRERTIRAVLEQSHPVTVIHDADIYDEAINQGAKNVVTFSERIPWTAVCWP